MPSGKGDRIQTPRSAAQRDQADAWGHSLAFAPKVEETAPRTSWWTARLSREEFDAKVAQEQRRMNASKVPSIKYQGSGIGE